MLDDIREGRSVSGDVALLVGMRVCPRPLFDPFTLECWSLYQELKAGLPLPWPYYEAPAAFMMARQIMAGEEMKIQQERKPDGQ